MAAWSCSVLYIPTQVKLNACESITSACSSSSCHFCVTAFCTRRAYDSQCVPVTMGQACNEARTGFRGETMPRAEHCSACRMQSPLFPFTMAFQPIVDIQERRIDAYEALVRGPGGEGAAHVLAQLTSTNLYAFDQACRVKAIEMAAHLGIDRQLNINFMPNAVYQPRACIQATLEAARRTGFDPGRLTFEIVENEDIVDLPHLLDIIAEYRSQGFKVALDDFATKYSGLSRLADLKPDIIKLDRDLVKDCDLERVRLAIIASMVSLGAEIGVKVVAEGIERTGEMEALLSVGMRYMQGYLFAKPTFEAIVTDADVRAAMPPS
jgi:EAL domain-containing protein (putative c-di-GMP-specific phosphodiesterase class I)